MDQLKHKIQNILINYTDACISELSKKFANANNVKKSDILNYLRNKYNIVGCPTRGQRNYWILRGYSKTEAEIKIKEYSHVYSTMAVESIMNRHNISKSEAENIVKDRVCKMKKTYESMSDEMIANLNKRKASNSLKNCISKYGKEHGSLIYEQRIQQLKDNVSLDGYIKRHGIDEGTRLYKEFCEKTQKQNTRSGYIERYGSQDGPIKYAHTQNKKSFSHTLAGYIERYGHEDGLIRYTKRQQTYIESLYGNKTEDELTAFHKSQGLTYKDAVAKHGLLAANSIFNSRGASAAKASTESLRVLIPFYKYVRRSGIAKSDIYWGINGSVEYFIRENEKFVTFDFTIRSIRVIIEYNGTVWHAKNPNDTLKHPYGKTASEVYAYDKQKYEMAERQGFTIITVWSDIPHKENLHNLIKQYENVKYNIR
jgi:hypothetical protein